MERSLPIVAGCTAIVIGYTNKRFASAIGTEVKCVRKSCREGWWTVESPLIEKLRERDSPVHTPESYLMRIDGQDFKHEKDSYELPLEIK